MLVRVEVDCDDTVLSITQQSVLSQSGSRGIRRADARSSTAMLTMGLCVGQMITALSAGSSRSIDVMIEEFHEAVLRAARPAAPDTPHTCDGVACC